MGETVPVKPELIRWAIERSGAPSEDLARTFPKLDVWKTGQRQPTLRQLELFADKTRTPLGYLLLDAVPDERLPIPDFRTVGDAPIGRPSPNLIDTLQAMQRRQAWMREYLVEQGEAELVFVGSAKQSRDVVSLATRIRQALTLDTG